MKMKTPPKKSGAAAWKKIKKVIILLINIAVLIVLIEFFMLRGLIGYVIFILGFGLWRMIKQRKQLMCNVRMLEGLMFGKPLDRDMWDKGEFKKRKKARFKWKKKKIKK